MYACTHWNSASFFCTTVPQSFVESSFFLSIKGGANFERTTSVCRNSYITCYENTNLCATHTNYGQLDLSLFFPPFDAQGCFLVVPNAAHVGSMIGAGTVLFSQIFLRGHAKALSTLNSIGSPCDFRKFSAECLERWDRLPPSRLCGSASGAAVPTTLRKIRGVASQVKDDLCYGIITRYTVGWGFISAD